jgi:hypothetical protein
MGHGRWYRNKRSETLVIRHDWIAIQKNNRRSFDSLRYAPVAQDDSYLVVQLLVPEQL